jgi:hypothetical protein
MMNPGFAIPMWRANAFGTLLKTKSETDAWIDFAPNGLTDGLTAFGDASKSPSNARWLWCYVAIEASF